MHNYLFFKSIKLKTFPLGLL